MRLWHRLSPARAANGVSMRSSLHARLQDESGIALVMAIGIMLVLVVALTTTIYLTSSAGRHASVTNAGQKAYALAETGVNNAVAVLNAHYPGTADFPGDSAIFTNAGCPCTTTYQQGDVTWNGTLAGPLVGPPWRWEWQITSTASVPNPTGPTSPVKRTATAVVPVVIPPTTPASALGPLNFLYAGQDMSFINSVQVVSPVYVTRDLHLESTSVIRGTAHKLAVGRDLYLKNPQNQIGLVSGITPADTRIDEAHVVNQCSSKTNPTLHACLGDPDAVYATVLDNTIPPDFLDYVPQLTCCGPVAGSINPPGSATSSNMGFWYQNADLGPLSNCTTSTGTPPKFDTASGTPDYTINNSATPTTPVNLTPFNGTYSCKTVLDDGSILGQLSWDATAKLLTIKGTIFIDGSARVDATGYSGNPVFRYTGQGTLVLSGTFSMKNSKICAVVSGSNCNLAAGAWDPNTAALVVVADGDGGNGGAESQSNEVLAGEAIHLKSSSFQGGLIANKAINVETTSSMQGPMISVYNNVIAGQSGELIFPTIYFAPSGGGGIVTDPPKPELLDPRHFSGG